MSTKYYYLVSGLPELNLDDNKLSFSVADLKEAIYNGLSVSDKKLIDLFFLKFDNANLLKLLKDKDAVLDGRGCFSSTELNEFISILKENGTISPKLFPVYLSSFISFYTESEADSGQLDLSENRLTSMYFDYALKSNNRFVSSWFEFNLNLNNILIAYSARQYKIEATPHIIGHNNIAEALRSSGLRDFSLSGEIEYYDDLMKIAGITELLEREKKMDELRWNWMENAIFFDFFTIERIFVFMVKLEMIERWISLDKEKGYRMFREIIQSLKNEVQIPEEFR
ncbi:MAG: DUF2764 family protein [Bacteroidaceae bacterium]|nr:DUF2764 domain-containing protein [Bacteroidaceae bacterium]